MIKHVEPQTGGIEIRKRKKKLTVIIRHILARPATCVPSERIFSKAGTIINTKLSSLSSKLADEFIFLCHDKQQYIHEKL